MKEAIVCVIGGVGLTQRFIELLAQRQITLEMLQLTTLHSSDAAMMIYIHALLNSGGMYEETAGPSVDGNYGNSN